MIIGIDHLVIACADPDAAASELESSLGLAVTGGGRHERLGTRNRIAWLADGSYLELIGVEDERLADSTPVGAAARRLLASRSAGLATFALADDDLAATVDRLRRNGSALTSPVTGSRRRPDGELVEWLAAFPATGLGPEAVPFLIEHRYAGAEWGPDALADRARFAHPLGSPVTLVELEIHASDPERLTDDLRSQLGLAVERAGDARIAAVGPHRLRLAPAAADREPAAVQLGSSGVRREAVVLGLRLTVAPGLSPRATSGRG